MTDVTAPLTDADVARLQSLLDAVPAPLQPLDVSALDGFLCGVLLQPRPVPAPRWLPFVSDMDGRPAPAGADLTALQRLALRRHAEIDRAIASRAWFDPWIFLLDEGGEDDGEPGQDGLSADDSAADLDADPAAEVPPPVRDAVLPWVAGFAAAMDAFPALMALDAPALVEPLALLYLYFEPDDLEDADALLAVIETLAPPADLADAVQDVVRALMLMADVTRPRPPQRQPGRPARGQPRRGGGRRIGATRSPGKV
jgi:uncharacterized protein